MPPFADDYRDEPPLRAPLPVGPFHLVPVDHPRSPDAALASCLTVDAHDTFGAGTHPTTRLLLARLPALLAPSAAPPAGGRPRLLDVGTGSGILALAAAQLGACALGVDTDPVAVSRALQNRRVNRIAACDAAHEAAVPHEFAAAQQVLAASQHDLAAPQQSAAAPTGCARFVLGDLGARVAAERFDLVLANLFAPSLIALAPALAGRLAEGALLVVSGVLLVDADRTERAFTSAGLRRAARDASHGWCCLTMRAP